MVLLGQLPDKVTSGVLGRLNHSTYNPEYASWLQASCGLAG